MKRGAAFIHGRRLLIYLPAVAAHIRIILHTKMTINYDKSYRVSIDYLQLDRKLLTSLQHPSWEM